MKKTATLLTLLLLFVSLAFADTTKQESSDDGYISKSGSSYTTGDYVWDSTKRCLNIYGAVGGNEKRGYKRFLMDMDEYTITAATLYWYLVRTDPDSGCTTACKLEQINDYGTLDATEAEYTGTVKHDYGDVMTYNQSAGWDSVDVTAEMEASKEDAYVAFRWRVSSTPAVGDIDYYIAAYEETSFKAYLVLTLSTGWSHKRDGVENASIAAIDGVVKASIASVDGVE